jgi:hypothetical protein
MEKDPVVSIINLFYGARSPGSQLRANSPGEFIIFLMWGLIHVVNYHIGYLPVSIIN